MANAGSQMKSPRYIVGIDLGTTNTVVAYSDGGEAPRLFAIPQLTAPHETSSLPRLPSFLYSPSVEAASAPEAVPALEADFSGEASTWLVGEFARKRAGEAPLRSIASAKSWLCHDQVSRTEPILPWTAADSDVSKLSPVAATSLILSHVRHSWDHAFPKAPLREQSVILTVPASFDPVARKLTVEAAVASGLKVRLLEEPQAAFYAALGAEAEAQLLGLFSQEKSSVLVLVCDVGGGTTDLCLIRASLNAAGALDLERIAVGRHLLLGGDNMDLALAHFMEARFCAPGEQLAPSQFAALNQACHAAKERLLGPNAPANQTITLLSSGSNLFQNTRTAELSRTEVENLVLEGFFPRADLTARPVRSKAGLSGFGLPYEREPRVSVHLATFFSQQAEGFLAPDAVLFNGGVFHSGCISERVLEILSSWSSSVTPLCLRSTSIDNAVAEGAVRYGLALLGQGIRISSGAAHGYYVGVASSAHQKGAVCVVPRGAKEGEVQIAEVPGLQLHTGSTVRFDLYASDALQVHAPGQIVEAAGEHFELLPPVATRFESAQASAVQVQLEGLLTPLGTLEIACIDAETQRRFELQFELRGHEGRVSAPPRSSASTEKRKLDEAYEAIQRVFGKGRSDVKDREVRDLFRNLEKLFGERRSWDLKVCRALFDVVGPKFAARRRSAEHERVFWMLAGLCLRPGFGHVLDAGRVSILEPLFQEGTSFGQEPRNWQAFWIAWRRIAGGLSANTQKQIRALIDPFVATEDAQLKKPKGWKAVLSTEMIELGAWLERVPQAERAALGGWLIERTWTKKSPELWAAVGRIGARVPSYASAHYAVSGRIAEGWADHLLREKWEQIKTAPRAALQLCRITGDRTRDVSELIRERVLAKLAELELPESYGEALRHLVLIEGDARLEQFEHDLPAGLSLAPPPLEAE